MQGAGRSLSGLSSAESKPPGQLVLIDVEADHGPPQCHSPAAPAPLAAWDSQVYLG